MNATGKGRPRRAAVAAVLAGLVCTAVIVAGVHLLSLQGFRRDFESAAGLRCELVREKLEEALLLVQSVRRFHAAAGELTGERFSAFAAGAAAGGHGLRALHWVPVVPGAGRTRFEKLGKRAWGPQFRIEERDGRGRRVRAGERDVYYPVSGVEPRDDDGPASLGFDCGSHPDVREALERARDTGEATATGLVPLFDAAPREGVLVFVPLYRRGARSGTAGERRTAVEGFAVAVVGAAELLRDALGGTERLGLPFDLLDVSEPPKEALLTHWSARLTGDPFPPAALVSPPRHRHALLFAGRRWVLEVAAGDAYLRRNYPLAHWALLPAGALLSLLLGGYLHSVLRARERAEAGREALEVEIGERRRAERELQASETRYRIVADHTGDWVFWLAPDGVFRYLSPACEQVTGHPPQHFEADPELFYRLVHPDDAARFAEHRRHAEGLGRTEGLVEFRIVRPDGQTRWLEHQCGPVVDANGAFLGTRGSNRDVTERKKLEGQLRQAHKLESLGILAGGTAHELNNILMAILGYAELTERRLDQGSPLVGKVKAIVAATLRAAELVRRLLTFAGEGGWEREWVSLPGLVRKLPSLLGAEVANGCALRLVVADGVPDVRGDEGQLQQVAVNLARNALEALGDGGGEVVVTVGVQQVPEGAGAVPCIDHNLSPGRYSFLEVRDDGCGIPLQHQAKIFDPFFTTGFPGRGLGLAVVRGVVRNHGGAIQVSSEVGRGTTVRVFLPAE